MSFTTKATIASFGGKLLKLTHEAPSTKCTMSLNLFLPSSASSTNKVPVLYYLAGLTCTPDNGAEKAFFQQAAERRGIAVVYPDTSPRGLSLPDEDDSYDFGSAASFYIDATRAPYDANYQMHRYLTTDLPSALHAAFPALDRQRTSITGHSMGGHGALMLYLRNPGMFRSVSAFAPIANPRECAWGRKALEGYLGPEREAWREWDATELAGSWAERGGGQLDILIDVGTDDEFYQQGQLLPENLCAAVERAGYEKGVTLRKQEGYNHSYFFISTFAEDHIEHAAKYLFAANKG